MKTVRAKLSSSIPGPGFVIRTGHHLGELDEYGVIWLTVVPTNRIPGERPTEKRIGVHAAKFAWIEEPGPAGATVNKRAEINAKIKAAEEANKANAAKARS